MGDRGRRPADQDDPDLYLHVVERREGGIVVRGAKAHTSGSVVANELVVIPQRAMRPEDADYAVAFAIPVDTPGLKLVCRGFSGENPDEFEAPVSSHDDLMESFTIFDDDDSRPKNARLDNSVVVDDDGHLDHDRVDDNDDG